MCDENACICFTDMHPETFPQDVLNERYVQTN